MPDDRPQDGRTPLWGWVLILIAIAMCIGMVAKSLSTGHKASAVAGHQVSGDNS